MYNESRKQSTTKYIRNNQKRIDLKIKKEVWENEIEPAILRSGLPVSTYIKQAIFEKIERENENS